MTAIEIAKAQGQPQRRALRPDTPEAVIAALLQQQRGSAVDVLGCVLARAHAVSVLLGEEFSGGEKGGLADSVIVNALWDIQGQLEIARAMLGGLGNRHDG